MHEHRTNMRTAGGGDLMQAMNGRRLRAKFGTVDLRGCFGDDHIELTARRVLTREPGSLARADP